MTPKLQRMQRLAGLSSTYDDSCHSNDEVDIDMMYDYPEENGEEYSEYGNRSCSTNVHSLIDELEELMPYLHVGEYKDVSQRLQGLMNVIFEEARPRKKKVDENDDTQTIGSNRSEAINSLKTRMGQNTTNQEATKAFDDMKRNGAIKQNGSNFTMKPMDDTQFKGAVSGMDLGNSGTN